MFHVYRACFDSYGLKNESCHTCGVLVSTFRLTLQVKLANLDLRLKERVMLPVQYTCFDSWHD